MCIIVYKPAGKHFPSWKTLKNCFERNPDGAGFMYLENDKVQVRKGFMTYSSFEKALKPLVNKNYNKPFVMHFRISTHGGINKELTQPFPLASIDTKLTSLSSNADVGIAHNGIIPITSHAKKLSDTALFVKRYGTFLIKDFKYYEERRTCEILEELASSRLCILSKDGHVEVLGSGWVEDNGIMYSNSSYEPYKVKRYSHSKYSKSKYESPVEFDPFECMMSCSDYDNCVLCPYQVDCWGDYLQENEEEVVCKVEEEGQSACYGCPNEKKCYYL